MKRLLNKIPVIVIIAAAFMFANSYADDSLYVWYGNLDGSPITADTSSLLGINAYTQTTSGAYIASMLLNLGADEDYFDSLLCEEYGEIYYPLTEWDMASFLPPEGSPPNPNGWLNQSFWGIAEMIYPYENYWLHFDDPTLTLKYVYKTSNSAGIVGDTAPCLGTGVNHPQGPSNAGDSAGMVSFTVAESFSPVYFEGVIGLQDDDHKLPGNTELFQNYPNPFNAVTTIEYSLAEPLLVNLTVYDIQGRVIKKLVDGNQAAGYHRIEWHAADTPSGMYFYKIQTDSYSQTNKMLLLK